MRFECLTDKTKLDAQWEFFILIIPNKTKNTLIVIDSGIGMTNAGTIDFSLGMSAKHLEMQVFQVYWLIIVNRSLFVCLIYIYLHLMLKDWIENIVQFGCHPIFWLDHIENKHYTFHGRVRKNLILKVWFEPRHLTLWSKVLIWVYLLDIWHIGTNWNLNKLCKFSTDFVIEQVFRLCNWAGI